ncbi:MAG TPA: nuclear transport factor 2 family protein [Acidimicrobiales bacterium]|nr:nuclear transport factor 2 family protein [Acidimicrobiales bacterium]
MVGELTAGDLVELRQLVDAYADAVDRLDDRGLLDVFTAGGTVRVQADEGPVENEWTGSGLTGSFDLLRPYHRTFHHVGGAVFEGAPDGASGRVHCVAHHYQRTGNGPVDLVMMITYHDRYTKQEGSWRIAERRVAIHWTELHPAHPARRGSR